MQRSKKPPTSEVVEASKSDWRNERNTSPPAGLPPRRDDRAEPDDDDGTVTSSRVDVVNVDGGGRDSASAGMVSLRRELAKLHQQAAQVEKSLEDQRRDRSESLDRLERATERVLFLESRLGGMEAEATSLEKIHETSLAELQTIRHERDDLRRAVESAKDSTAELDRLKEEVERLRASAEEAKHAGSELAKAREDVARALAEAKQAKADADKAREAVSIAEGDAAMVGDQASKIRDEAAKIRAEAEAARGEAEKARAEAMAAREEAAKITEDLKKAREEAAKLGEELGRAREDLTRAKADNTRDRETARDRIDLIERALDDARASTSRTESELEAARTNEERLGRQLEAAQAAASDAESRASATAMAHAALELSLRRLREEIAGAFARVGQGGTAGVGGPPPLPAPRQQQQAVSVPPEMIESLPPDAMSLAPPSSQHIPSMPPVPSAPPRFPSGAPAEAQPESESMTSSPVSKSVPPPQASMPPPTYASVPPQVHPSTAPAHATSPPPPGGHKTAPPPPAHASIPPAARGSIPPAAKISVVPDAEAPPPSDGRSEPPPATRRPGASMPPPPADGDLMSPARQQLLAKLADPDEAEMAAVELLQRPQWLRSDPPPTLLTALSHVDYDAEGTIFEIARAWDREPLCHAIIASLRSETEPRVREHSAWLLKHLAAPSSWKAIADLARSDDEAPQTRRWLLEALDRLAAGRAIGWRELGDMVTSVARHSDASLRDGVVGILLSLDRSDDKRRLLLEILRTDSDEVVLASAVNALASVLPMELDQTVMTRLLEHPSPRVQRSVRDLIERAKTKQ